MEEKKTKILIVEDESRIARFLEIELKHEGFETETEQNGRQAFERIKKDRFDLILLDWMLPGMDGLELCRKVREFSEVPIIMLTARDEIEDKVSGLDIGADDYITKPFAMQELLARIRNALRKRGGASELVKAEKLQIMDLIMYSKSYEVKVSGEEVQLTRREYELLEYMLRNKRVVLTRDQILQAVWGYDYAGDTNVVDVYLRYLRSKIEEPYNKKYIHTIRGVGYVIKE